MATLVQAPTAVNGSAGANVNLIAKTFARYAEVQEDGPSANWQGLTITWPNGNVDNYPPSAEPVTLAGNKPGVGGATGPLVGMPAGALSPANAATVYAQVKSLTATATSVHVTEVN